MTKMSVIFFVCVWGASVHTANREMFSHTWQAVIAIVNSKQKPQFFNFKMIYTPIAALLLAKSKIEHIRFPWTKLEVFFRRDIGTQHVTQTD